MKPISLFDRRVFRRALAGALVGALLGLIFPWLAVYLMVLLKGLEPSLGSVLLLVSGNPLIWVITPAPVVIGAAAWLVEANRARLHYLTEEMDERVKERSGEISLQKQYFETLVDVSPVAVVTLDNHHRITDCNPAFERLFGYTLDEIQDRELDDIIADPEIRPEAEALTRQVQKGETIRSTGVRRGKNGKSVEVEIFGAPVIVAGQQIGVLGLYNDISERRQALIALTDSEKNFRTLASSTIAAIFIIQDGRLKFINPAAENLIGYSAAELIQSDDFSAILTGDSQQLGDIFAQERINIETTPSRFESTISTRAGKVRWVDISLAAIKYNSRPALLMTFFDITDRKQSEVNLKFLATHDPLTGLPNRVLFQDRLTHALAFARRSLQRVGVMFVDLDGFKQVNDRFGHEKGDQILRELGHRMQICIRSSDTVARLGGDEFTFILEHIDSAESAVLIAEKVLNAIRQPFVLDETTFSISASIGISIYPDDGDDAEELVKLADGLMYHAKRAGKNQCFNVSNQNIFPSQAGDLE
jgi:diguanylate cyclase (GGDEF)-like protein/PAS domain S-box-containing protein